MVLAVRERTKKKKNGKNQELECVPLPLTEPARVQPEVGGARREIPMAGGGACKSALADFCCLLVYEDRKKGCSGGCPALPGSRRKPKTKSGVVERTA